MIPQLVRFTAHQHDKGVYVDASNIAAISYVESDGEYHGTWIQTYRGMLWHVVETPDECYELLRSAEWGGGR